MRASEVGVQVAASELRVGDRILTLGKAPEWLPTVLAVVGNDSTSEGNRVVRLDDGTSHLVLPDAQITAVRPI